MQGFTFKRLDISDLVIVDPFYVEDGRGYFLKSYEKGVFQQVGIKTDIFEDFESYSKKGVVRGLHFQTKNPQAKLIRAIQGKIFDVSVDIRRESPTFGQWRGVYLSGENRKALFVPAGFAHGFLVISDIALVSYKCSGQYLKKSDTGIIWNDPDIGVEWPLELIGGCERVILSDRDKELQSFASFIRTCGGL